MNATDIISIIKDIFLGLSALAIAGIAWKGLGAWRNELSGKARFETARTIMRLGNGFRSNYHSARFVITVSGESTDRQVLPNETPDETIVRNEWHARAKRLNCVVDDLNKLREAEWEAEILFGEKIFLSVKKSIQSYRSKFAELSSAISSYFDTRADEARTGIPYKDQDWLRGLHKEIYSIGDDEHSKVVNEATEQLSSSLKQYVKE